MNRTILLAIFGVLISLNIYAENLPSAKQASHCLDDALGGTWIEGELVTSEDGATSDFFSYSIFGGVSALDSDGIRMIVGAPADDINGFTYAGAAYIYDLVDGAWVEQQKLTPFDPATVGESTVFGGFLYGYNVSIDGDIAVVGEPEYNNNGAGFNLLRNGQATVYRYNSIDETWDQDSILNAVPVEVFESSFGNSVTVDADGAPDGKERILVGGLGKTSEGGFWTGKAFVFDWNGSSWDMIQLNNPAPSSNDYFGAYSDLDGDTAIIGTGSANNLAGETWIFEFSDSSWGAGISLHGLVTTRFSKDRFGSAVAVDGDFAVVGAYDSNAGGDGSVYIFWNNPEGSWELFDTLTDGDGDNDDQFGKFVEIEGNRLLVSAPNNEVGDTTTAGSVYVYEFDGNDWVFKQQINRNMLDAGDGFAFGVTFAGEQLLIGAGYDDTTLVNQGGVVVYNFRDELIFESGMESCDEGAEVSMNRGRKPGALDQGQSFSST